MARIKGATMTHKRRKKMLKLAKGFYGCKSKHFKMAKQQVMKSGNYMMKISTFGSFRQYEANNPDHFVHSFVLQTVSIRSSSGLDRR